MEPSELDDWAAEAAAAVGVTLQPGDVAAVLDLARDAAHGVARPAAPLTTFIAGMAVGRGQPTAEAIAALVAAIERRSAGDTGSSESAAEDGGIGRGSAADAAPSEAAAKGEPS